MKVSVIIPTLNEERDIEGCIRSAIAGAPSGSVEIIVADGGSVDNTIRRARMTGASVMSVASDLVTGRGAQMDAASAVATGDVFIFLHADSRLPGSWFDDIRECLKDKRTVAGGFTFSVDSAGPWYRVMERGVGFRSRTCGLIYGDQAIFARREAFERAGGYRKLPLMEDVDCVNRLKRLGKLRVLDEKVLTSARRWERGGIVITTLKNWIFLLLYFMGVSPVRLHSWYYSI